MIIETVISIIIAYLIGAVNFALVIGKVFFKTDVRNYGSKNLGGSNAGRVLGKKAGFCVMVLDVAKVIIAMGIGFALSGQKDAIILAGLAAGLGHCYPVWAGFKGGKAVAALYGFFLGMIWFGGCSYLLFFLPLCVFLVVLYMGKMISLSSMISAACSTVYIGITADSALFIAVSFLYTALVIWRHRSNVERIRQGKENKITWM